LPAHAALGLVELVNSASAAFSQSAELLAAGLVTLPIHRDTPGITVVPWAATEAAFTNRATDLPFVL
jgi:hypothetical protein